MYIMNKLLSGIAKRRPIRLEIRVVEPTHQLSNKTALIIGGTSGIGKSIANVLQQAGCRVIICGRKVANTHRFENEIWDVSEIELIPGVIDKLILKYGKIDIVVNSQGICPESDFHQKIYEIDPKDFERVLKTNTESVFFICQKFCQYFEQNHIQGHILNICSTEGLRGTFVPYGISKAAVVSLTKGLGKIMAEKGITVNGIAPGATATSMMRMNAAEDIKRTYIPSRRACIPEEIAKAALFMISDSGNQMCGEVLVMDGGESLH